jgi:uncharacterized membrane protein YfcA
MSLFTVLVTAASILASAIASMTGFGIGSILTPLLAVQTGTKVAVAVIAIPHFVATLIRFWMLKSHLDRNVLIRFGVASAIGGLIGALLNSGSHNSVLTIVFGALLIFSGFMTATGYAQKMKFHGVGAWLAGVLSGGFGGLVGNQGGIRAAAMATFDLSKESFVATSTAIGVVVDLARLPVYISAESSELLLQWRWISLSTCGVLIGTFLGMRFLQKISQAGFRRLLGVLIFLLGVYMLLKGGAT